MSTAASTPRPSFSLLKCKCHFITSPLKLFSFPRACRETYKGVGKASKASIIWPLATCQSSSRWPTPFQPQGTTGNHVEFLQGAISGIHTYPKALSHPIRALPVLITFSTLPDPVQALPLSGFPQPPTPFQQLNSKFLPCGHSSVFSPLFQYLPYKCCNYFSPTGQ